MPRDKKDNAVPATLAANVPESFAAEAYINEWSHRASEAVRALISNEGEPGLQREDAYISEWSPNPEPPVGPAMR